MDEMRDGSPPALSRRAVSEPIASGVRGYRMDVFDMDRIAIYYLDPLAPVLHYVRHTHIHFEDL